MVGQNATEDAVAGAVDFGGTKPSVGLGSGVGGGVMLGGRLLEGSHGLAGEIGHLVVQEGGAPCGCGNRGCLEAMASGTAIARRARAAGLEVRDAAEVARRAREGDAAAAL